MSKRFYTHIDLRNNQLLQATLENIDSTSVTSGNLGRVFWAIDLNKPCYWDGFQVREFFYKGEALDPSTIIQIGLDATAQEFLVSGVEKDEWNQLVSDSTGFEYLANKNQVDGYAGLQDATSTRPGKLDLEILWTGMVLEVPDGTNLVYKTWGELLDEPYGIPQLDADSKLDPYTVNQVGFDSTEMVRFVSEDDIDRWNTVAIDGTGYELQENKDQADGYAGLDSSGWQNHETQSDGVVIRVNKIVTFTVDSTGELGDSIHYTYENGLTYYFYFDDTGDTKATVLAEMQAHISTTLPQSIELNSVYDGSTSITVSGLAIGHDFGIAFGAVGSWTSTQVLDKPAFYDLSNIGGVPTLGFAPLDVAGIVPNQYLPDYKDIKVVDTYDSTGTTLLGIPVGDLFNGMRAHVVNATDDPNNLDSSGWAEYLWVDQPPIAAYWLRTAEKESSVDINHNSTLNKQGGDVGLEEFYHLDYIQYQRIDDMEFVIRIANHNVLAEVDSQLQILAFDSTQYRAAKIMLTIEDNGPGYQGTVLQELTLMYDGNYPFILEYGDIGNMLTNPVTFIPDQDINNIKLFAQSDSTNMSFFIRVKLFESFNSIISPLTPQVDLLAANSLFPDYISEWPAIVPTGTQEPGPPLVPSNP